MSHAGSGCRHPLAPLASPAVAGAGAGQQWLKTPQGAPLAWRLRERGHRRCHHVRGAPLPSRLPRCQLPLPAGRATRALKRVRRQRACGASAYPARAGHACGVPGCARASPPPAGARWPPPRRYDSFVRFLARLGTALCDTDSRRLFNEMDHGASGKIAITEFYSILGVQLVPKQGVLGPHSMPGHAYSAVGSSPHEDHTAHAVTHANHERVGLALRVTRGWMGRCARAERACVTAHPSAARLRHACTGPCPRASHRAAGQV